MHWSIWFIFSCSCVWANTNGTESDLLSTLFDGYISDVRPRRNRSETVDIKLDMYVMSIDKIDEVRQTFTIRSFMEITWRDDFLTWIPAKYGGVTTINVPNTKLWLPDLALLDVYDSLTDIGQDDGRALIDFKGTVTVWPYKMYTVGCKIKIRHFPFDIQICSLDFLSWTNPVSVLNLKTSDSLNLGRYSENAVWSLEDYNGTYYQHTFGNESWAHIKFVFTLRRKWLFHLLNIIVPIVVISSLNVTCFILPAASGEKITLCISIFLTLAVFLTIISSIMPESSDDVSLFAVYVGLQLIGSALSILATVASLCIYNRDKNTRVSNFLCLLCKLFGFHDKKKENFISNQQSDNVTKRRPLRIDNSVDSKTYIDDSNMAENNVNYLVTSSEPDVTWETASRAFDRLLFWLTVCWQLCLLIGVLVGLNY